MELMEQEEKDRKEYFSHGINVKGEKLMLVIDVNINKTSFNFYKEDVTTTFLIKGGKLAFIYDISGLSPYELKIINCLDGHALHEFRNITYPQLFNGTGTIHTKIPEYDMHLITNIKAVKLSIQIRNELAKIYKELINENPNDIIDNMLFRSEINDRNFAKLYFLLSKNSVLFDEINKSWYLINEYNTWIKDDGSKICNNITNLLEPCITQKFGIILGQVEEEFKIALVTNFNKCLKYIKTNQKKKSILDELKGIFPHDKVFEKMDNINPYLFAFENGVFDFDKFIFRLAKPCELVSITCGYDFSPITFNIQHKMDMLDKILSSMFKSTDDLSTILQSVAQSLIAIPLEQCYIWLGNGGNGKGVLKDMIEKTFGCYFNPIPIDYFTKTKHGQSATAADEVLAGCKNTRIAMLSEPESDMTVRVAKIKELSGGDKQKARHLYGKAFDFNVKFKMFFLTNYSIEIPNSGNSIARRFVCCRFPYNFCDKPIMENDKKADPDIKAKVKSEDCNIAFFHILLRYYKMWIDNKKEIKLSDNIMEETRMFIQGNDSVSPFLSDFIEKTGEDKDFIKISDLYKAYKSYTGNESVNNNQFKTSVEGKGFQIKISHGYQGIRGIKINTTKLNEILGKNKRNQDIDFIDV